MLDSRDYAFQFGDYIFFNVSLSSLICKAFFCLTFKNLDHMLKGSASWLSALSTSGNTLSGHVDIFVAACPCRSLGNAF